MGEKEQKYCFKSRRNSFSISERFPHILIKMGKKKNKEKKTFELEKDLKKDVVTDPSILKQELEVLIKNLNKQKNLQESFVLKDEDVTEVDDGDSSGDENVEGDKRLKEDKKNQSKSQKEESENKSIE